MDQDFNLWQKLFQSKPVMRATGGLRYLLGNEQEKNQLSDLWGEDVDNSLPAIMGLTKPFRMGSNILGQYYGSALTGKDMTQQENQGKFLQWLSSSLTPEEQTQIEEKPYLNALKSSAGMASTLMPFAKAGVVGNVGSKMANPTLSKFTNLLSRGGLEGGVGGFGYSREGKELQDTLLGMGLGAGGEVLGSLISDPTFRRGMGQEIMKGGVTPEGRYTAFAKLGDDIADDADNVIDLTKDKLYLEARKYKTPEEFIKNQKPLYHGTAKAFDKFDESHYGKGVGWADQGDGVYLTESREAAQEFGDVAARNRGFKNGEDLAAINRKTGEVLDVRLENATKVLDFDTSRISPERAKELLRKGGVSDNLVDSISPEELSSPRRVVEFLRYSQSLKENPYKFITKELGYDAIRLEDPRWSSYLGEISTDRNLPEKIKTVVVYNPKKVTISSDIKVKPQLTDTLEDLTKPMEERLLDSRTIGEAVRDDTMKLRNIGKDGQTIFKVTRDNPPKSTRPVSKPKYSDLIKAAKKEARSSKIPIRFSEEDLLEEMRKTGEKWGLFR